MGNNQRGKVPQECYICDSVNIKPVGNYKDYTLYDCGACGAQFWWPLKHPGHKFYETPVFRAGRLQWRQKQFLKNPPIKSGRVLDIGCGLGNFLVALSKKFRDIEAWGIDISKNQVEFIKKTYGLKHIYAADLKTFLKREDLPKFDAVTMFELIEHVENPNELLQDIKKLLAPRGFVVISTPNVDRFTGVYDGEDLPPHHFWRWHPKTLKFLLWKNGFGVIRLIEEPLGKDFLYRVVQSIGLFRNIKAFIIRCASPKIKSENYNIQQTEAASNLSGVGKKRSNNRECACCNKRCCFLYNINSRYFGRKIVWMEILGYLY